MMAGHSGHSICQCQWQLLAIEVGDGGVLPEPEVRTSHGMHRLGPVGILKERHFSMQSYLEMHLALVNQSEGVKLFQRPSRR